MNNRPLLNLNRIAVIGRTYDEYLKIFDLDEDIMRRGPVLDCPAGASSFAVEANKLGMNVTASDTVYNLPSEKLIAKAQEDLTHVFEKFDEVSHLYSWSHYKDKDDVISHRKKALELFAADFKEGCKEGCYVYGKLPNLPFPDKAFSLVTSGHFLFLYGDRLDFEFHKACLKELVRVCFGEVRIFPLVGLDARPYPNMDETIAFLKAQGVKVEILNVLFEFQKGANRMMRLICG